MIGRDQEYLCEHDRQKGKEHRVADNGFHGPAIHNRVLVWSLLAKRYVVDAQGEFRKGEDRTLCIILS